MRNAILGLAIAASVACGTDSGGAGGGAGGAGGSGGSGGSGGAAGAAPVDPATCGDMCHHIYWGCHLILYLRGEPLNDLQECVEVCEEGRIPADMVQCLATAPCSGPVDACTERPKPSCDTVCYQADACQIEFIGDCLERCRAKPPPDARLACMSERVLRCDPRFWTACE